MNNEFEILQELQGAIKNAANTVSRLMELKKQFKDKVSEVKRDWEILALSLDGKLIKDHLSLYHFSERSKMYRNFIIHSVRRLSDNSVWVIGQETNYGIIEKFFMGWAGMEVHFTDGCGATLTSLPKIPERTKLFTTSDNKDVYVGDKVFYVGMEGIVTHWIVEGDWDVPDPSTITFYSEDKANEYQLMNKPCLSVNDVQSVYSKGRSFVGTDFLIEGLKELAKQKLNKQ